MKTLQDLLLLLISIREMKAGWNSAFNEFYSTISDSTYKGLPDYVENIITELYIDMSFYVENPELRTDDPSYIGEDELRKIVAEAIQKIEDHTKQ